MILGCMYRPEMGQNGGQILLKKAKTVIFVEVFRIFGKKASK